jgi:hypothetical protein
VLIKCLYEMHGATIKMVNAQQAKLNNNCKNTKLKLLKTNEAVWFNKMCKIKQLKSQAAYHTTHIVRRTLSGVPSTQYDMLPQHQINIRN